jgi:hypothetical protein
MPKISATTERAWPKTAAKAYTAASMAAQPATARSGVRAAGVAKSTAHPNTTAAAAA